jgi:DNA end-binding protein Ku
MATRKKPRRARSRKPASRKAAGKGSGGRAARKAAGGTGGGHRPAWSGQLRLALVSVPVLIYPATKSGARLSFHQVHGPSGKRIRYEKVVPGIGPVDADEILKGFEIAKDRYVLLEDEEIDSFKIEARKTLDLVQFVDHCEIDPIWFDRPYYVTPDGELAEEAYRVIRDALRSTRKIAIGQLVMRGREHIVALKPCGDGLLLETLRFADEVTSAAPLFAGIGKGESDRELRDLAETLIRKKVAPYDPAAFKDHYTEALRAAIEAKARRGKPIEVEEDERPRGGAEIIDLVEALKRSVRGARRPGGETASRRRKAR